MTKDNHINKENIVRSAAQTATLMAILTLISKVFGFLREMVMANYFGASYITDAYVMSFTILTVLFGGLITAVSTAYIPIFSDIKENRGAEAGRRFTNNTINILLFTTVIISLIGILFSDQLVALLASGFTGKTADLASFFVKVLFSYVVFSSSSGILESYLQYRGTFLPQIISGYFVSLCTIGAVIISYYTSYYYLAFGVLIGHFMRFITMWIIAGRRDYKHRFGLYGDDSIKRILALALPTFVGSYMLNINLFVDRTLASNLVEGSISALNYASLLNGMIMGLTITILSTIIYPRLTQANSLEQYDRFNSIIGTGINVVVIISLPCALGSMVYSQQIVHIVYERGTFDTTATAMTSSAFLFYSCGLLFMSLNDLLTRAYYSMHNMKTPMFFAGFGVIINIVLNLILVRFMAHNGLALATSIASFISTLLLYKGMRIKYPHIKVFQSRLKIIKIAAAAIISIGLSYVAYISITKSHLMNGQEFPLLTIIVVAGVLYLGMLVLFRVEEVKLIRQILKFR